MSFSTSTLGTVEEIVTDLNGDKRALAVAHLSDDDPVKALMLHSYDVALTAVGSFCEATGRPGDTYSVSISGHSNPDHDDTSGWATDCLNLSVVRQARTEPGVDTSVPPVEPAPVVEATVEVPVAEPVAPETVPATA